MATPASAPRTASSSFTSTRRPISSPRSSRPRGVRICAGALAVLGAWGPAAADDAAVGLRALARPHGIEIGTAISPAGMGDALYLDLLTRHFGLVVPEYGMYMSNLRPAPDAWDFARMDATAAFARRHGLAVRGHALIWALPRTGADPFVGWRPTPAWVNDTLSRDQAIAVMNDHIATVIGRYRGRVAEWVVVNEVLGPRPVDGLGLNPTIWLDLIGPDYIKLAFEQAREADPDAVLMLNDYGADYRGQDAASGRAGPNARVDSYYRLVVRLLEQGAPIDGVGFQFHFEVGRDMPSVDDIAANLARYRAQGLSTHVTELDVRIPKPVTEAKLRAQARVYETVFRAVTAGAADDIVMWGFTDRYSWITAGEAFPDHAAGVILDRALGPRPAFHALSAVLAGTR